MSIPEKCDVVIIGGGPAGSMTAAVLAEKGYEVALFDKQKHPRYHIGESLLPDFWKHADAVGVSDRIIEEGFVTKSGGIVSWHGMVKSLGFSEFGYDRPALHVERDVFDLILLDNAREKGAQVYEEVAVIDVDLGGRPVATVRAVDGGEQRTIKAKFIVDASGQNAVVGRKLGIRRIDETFRYMSVWGYFKGAKYLDFHGNLHPADNWRNVAPTTFVASVGEGEDEGWLWHIPQREATSVGLVIPIHTAQKVKRSHDSWETYFEATCRGLPIERTLLEDAELVPGSVGVINDYSFRTDHFAGPGYFLVGDAAGFVDPIFSVGVVMAMYSGRIAAWAIDRSLADPSLEAQSRELFSTQLEGRIEVARSLALPSTRDPGETVTELAKSTVRLEAGNVQQLMHAASSLTTRSQNFLDLVESEADIAEFEDHRVRDVPHLEALLHV